LRNKDEIDSIEVRRKNTTAVVDAGGTYSFFVFIGKVVLLTQFLFAVAEEYYT
jgi:hypothetical protein